MGNKLLHIALLPVLLAGVGAQAGDSAKTVLELSGVQGGLVVHLGCGDGELTTALRATGAYLVQGLAADEKDAAATLESIRTKGLAGPISVRQWSGTHLPYADGVVNLLVVSGNPSGVSGEEMIRVLAPRGVICRKTDGKWEKVVKPWPKTIDEWTHYLHSASGNAVAADQEVGHPGRMQWNGGPKYCRNHEMDVGIVAVVSAEGRLFSIIDEGIPGIMDPRLPEKWALVGRDAFSGVVLWKRKLDDWGWRQWKPDMNWGKLTAHRRIIPIGLPRRLVAVGNEVYATPTYDGPVVAMNAATGKILKTYEGTTGADEILWHDGILLLTVRAENRERAGGTSNAGVVMALDAASGKTLWRTESVNVLPMSLTAAETNVFYHTMAELRCLDLKSGKQRWQAKDVNAGAERWAVHHTLVAYKDVILVSTRQKLEAFAASDGKLLWTGRGGRKGFGSVGGVSNPPNLYVIDDLVWAPSGKDIQGLNPWTGAVRRSFTLPDLFYTAGHHFRCYRGKATDNFILDNKRGTEFMHLHGENHTKNDWVRGVCRYGILPCNGLLYSTPTPCSCYASVQLHGFNALAPRLAREAITDVVASPALVKGPAFGKTAGTRGAAKEDWPTFRADTKRSGVAGTSVPREIEQKWEAKPGGRLTQPVVVANKLFIASNEAQTLYAMAADTGKIVWSVTVDGRIDSPPTWHDGRLFFGSRNGWVYCLDAADGTLAWRVRAATDDRQIVSYNQLESVWPVHGSVLVLDGLVYAAAGRNSYLDGGIRVVALDAATGELKHESSVINEHQDPATTEGHHNVMEGSKPDILVFDGQHIHMQSISFDRTLNQVDSTGNRIFATAGLLDDLAWNRNFWVHGKTWTGPNKKAIEPCKGQLLVYDGELTYGVRYFTDQSAPFSVMFYPAKKGYCLFADESPGTKPAPIPAVDAGKQKKDGKRRKGKKEARGGKADAAAKWQQWIPVRVRAMVKSGDVLFIAGTPDVLDEKDPLAALEGRKGAVLQAVSVEDGEKLSETKLTGSSVFDGMIAANGRLYLAMRDGRLLCFAGALSGQPSK